MKLKIKEKDLQRQILDYLKIRGRFHYRNNSGAASIPQKNGKSTFLRFGALGSPDIVCVVNGIYIGIEVKGAGGKQSDHQKEFQKNLEKAGGEYILAFCLEDVLRIGL